MFQMLRSFQSTHLPPRFSNGRNFVRVTLVGRIYYAKDLRPPLSRKFRSIMCININDDSFCQKTHSSNRVLDSQPDAYSVEAGRFLGLSHYEGTPTAPLLSLAPR